MRQKPFLILASITGVSLLAAAGSLLTGHSTPAFALSGERVFPSLESTAADVARVTIRDNDFEMELTREDGRFIDAASGYPINPEPLRELVSGMALAEIAEAKTRDPLRHADLLLADPDAAAGTDSGTGSGSGQQVVLFDESGNELANVIAGRRDFTLGGVTGGQYLRRGGEADTWLAQARIDAPTRRAAWFDTALLNIEVDTLATMTLNTADAVDVPLKVAEGVPVLGDELLPSESITDEKLNRVEGLWQSLDFADVRAHSENESNVEGAALIATLDDGTHVTLRVVTAPAEGESTWIAVDVAGDSERAVKLQERTQGFEFALTQRDAEIFTWTAEQLTEEPPAS